MSFLDEWIFNPTNLPAWLQAVAAFVALGLSYAAIRATGAEERKRDLWEQRGIGVAIYPDLCMLPTTVQNIRQNMGKLPLVDGDQSFALNLQNVATVQMPPMIERNIDRLFLLGDAAGPSCLSLVRFVLQHNETVRRFAAASFAMNVARKKQMFEEIGQHLSLLENIIDKCEHDVRPIHDSIKS